MEGDAGAAYDDGEALPDGEGQYMEGEEGEGGERYYDEEVRAGPWALGSGVANSMKATGTHRAWGPTLATGWYRAPLSLLLRAWHAQAEDYQEDDMGMGHAGQPGLDDDGRGLYQPMHDGGGMPSVISK